MADETKERAARPLANGQRHTWWALRVLPLVALLFVATACLKAHLYGNNASALIGFGCASPASCWSAFNHTSLPRNAVVFRTGGYDGQFFYYLGREILRQEPARVDSPPFRRARIGLPLLASPLLAAGNFGKVYGLPVALLALHLLSVWLVLRRAGEHIGPALLFAFNPFSLISFLLCTADGAALSLAVMGALLLEASGSRRWLGAALVAAALLTKETMVVVPAALGCAWLLDTRFSLRSRVARLGFALVTPIPLALWWKHVGFSFGLAATHGDLPFVGVLRYLPHADFGRALLVLILFTSLATAASLFPLPGARSASLILLGTAALISTATAHEYWATTANIARLFTPMAAAPVMLLAGASGVSPLTGGRRRLWGAWAALLVVLTVTVVVREGTRSALGFFVVP